MSRHVCYVALLTVLCTLGCLALIARPVTASPALPVINAGGVVLGAGFAPAAIAPGSIITVFGQNLSASTDRPWGMPLPTMLGGVRVLVSGQEAPLFFVSPTQINAQVPTDAAPGSTPVVVDNNGVPSAPATIQIAPASPGIFTLGGGSQGAITIANTSLVAMSQTPAVLSRAAQTGESVSIFCTGLGATDPAVAAGSPAPLSPLASVKGQVSLTIGGVPATVSFQGLTPGFAGLYQVDARVPDITPGEAVPVVLSQGAAQSNTATMAVSKPAAVNPTVKVWLTTDDQRAKMTPQAPLSFSAGYDTAANTVFIDETQVYQQIEGFGASITDSSAYLLNHKLPASQLNAVMTSLFDRETGIGISFLRNPMGASDLARNIYSYDDVPAGQTDPGLARFSIEHDLADVVPLTKLAKQINPQVKVMATPWSAPGWMKTSGSMVGGSLSSAAYTAFANYFVKYIQAYAAQGLTIDYISLQNEPLFVPGDYPGMSMDGATQRTVLRDFVLPALSANHLSTKVLVYDHNWDRPDYPDTVLGDPALANSSQVAGIAWHGYGGTPGVMTTLQKKYPAKGQYETEHSGGTWVPDQVKEDFQEIPLVLRNWARTFVKWGLALDEDRGPHTGGCGTCTPLVTINQATGAATYPIDYYTLGHFSKFVAPGASRIYSSNATGIVSVAFRNPDGSKALVAFNDTNTAQTVQIVWGRQSFHYTLPAFAGATSVWSGAGAGAYTVRAASQRIQASSYNDTLGLQAEYTTDIDAGYDVGYGDDGDWALYRSIDFASGVASVDVRASSNGAGGKLEFHLGAPGGPLIASVTIPITGGWQTWKTVSAPVSGATGVNDVYVVFRGASSIGNINWFQFR